MSSEDLRFWMKMSFLLGNISGLLISMGILVIGLLGVLSNIADGFVKKPAPPASKESL